MRYNEFEKRFIVNLLAGAVVVVVNGFTGSGACEAIEL
jgi:hypothetical protein